MTREEFNKLKVGDAFIYISEHIVYDTLKDGIIRYEVDGKIFCVDYYKCSLPNIDCYKQLSQRWEQSYNSRYKEIQDLKIKNFNLKEELEKVNKLTSEVDWEQRLYETSRDMLCALLTRTNIYGEELESTVSGTIYEARELIKQLKQNKIDE